MRPLVVLTLDPGEQQPVDALQAAAAVEVDASEEPAAHGEEPALQLGPALRLVGARVQELDAEPRAQGKERAAAEDLAVVEVEAARHATLEHRLLETVLERAQVLLEVELGVHDEAGRIV